ncbi:MAG: hypothetical protein AVDCRST_MAG71-1674 [uncultured Lysobacter sp.]|uniref:Uncharacterized protein n=1 Tax=uncultured Lysobacter sp. TaxID=271060 RepID=A0A6J4LE84_9GAMM|nr:MAG: hypothetical protein AVDCRST_MAG71-1674 [uncultured Lysobacter sp.]
MDSGNRSARRRIGRPAPMMPPCQWVSHARTWRSGVTHGGRSDPAPGLSGRNGAVHSRIGGNRRAGSHSHACDAGRKRNVRHRRSSHADARKRGDEGGT